MPAPPGEARPAQPDAPVIDVPVSDELIWRDAPQDLQPPELPEAEAAAPGVDASQPDEQPVPVREDQIWSGPEAVEPDVQRIEPEPAAAQPEPAC